MKGRGENKTIKKGKKEQKKGRRVENEEKYWNSRKGTERKKRRK